MAIVDFFILKFQENHILYHLIFSVFAHFNLVFVVSPAVIVGISMGATKLDGYGNSQ